MKMAVIVGSGEDTHLVVEAAPSPTPKPGEVLVRVHARSLNYRDLMVLQGLVPVAEGTIPLSDGAGEVIAVGQGVSRLAVGDRVVSQFFPRWRSGAPTAEKLAIVTGDQIDGFAAEEVVVAATNVTPIPDSLSFAEAATLPCAALTSWRALAVETQIKPGSTVLVQGTGGVSLFGLQFAKAMGARVIATPSSPEKEARLKAMAADATINYRDRPEWGKQAFDLTDGRGIDAVIDVGGPGNLDQSVQSLRIGG